jgi:hypothetical protein
MVRILKKAPIAHLPLAFRVALNTQIIGALKRHHCGLVAGSAGFVAAQTLHRQVFVPWINNLCADRMGGMGFPFVTLPAQINGDILLGNQQNIVGGMGGMTGAAITFFYRFTQSLVFGIINGPFLQLDGILMTFAAGGDHGSLDEVFLFGAVGIVAIQTTDRIHHG